MEPNIEVKETNTETEKHTETVKPTGCCGGFKGRPMSTEDFRRISQIAWQMLVLLCLVVIIFIQASMANDLSEDKSSEVKVAYVTPDEATEDTNKTTIYADEPQSSQRTAAEAYKPVQKWVEADDSKEESVTASENPGWLGVVMHDTVIPDLETSSVIKGAMIIDVAENSPAWDASMEEGDIIVAVNGNAIRTAAEMQNFMQEHTTPGQMIVISVIRNVDGSYRQGEVGVVAGQKP